MSTESTPNDHAGTASVLLGLSNGAHLQSAQPTANIMLNGAEQVVLPDGLSPTIGISDAALAARRRSQVSALPRKEWSAKEDELIRDGVQKLGCRWRVIAAQLPGRSDDAVRNRWSRLQDNVRSRSTEGEKRNGGSSGTATASPAASQLKPPGPVGVRSTNGSGCSKSGGGGESAVDGAPVGRARASSDSSASSSRAGESASPLEKGKKERSSWTRTEDDIIIQGVAELGHKWYEIARRLPGRTDHAIRNRWSRLQSIIGQQDVQHLGDAQPRTGLASSPASFAAIPAQPLKTNLYATALHSTQLSSQLAAFNGGDASAQRFGELMQPSRTNGGKNGLGDAASARMAQLNCASVEQDAFPAGLPRDAILADKAAANSQSLATLKASPSAANLCLALNGGFAGDTNPSAVAAPAAASEPAPNGPPQDASGESLALKRPRV